VKRSEGDRFQNKKIERSRQKFGLFGHGVS
jgi:hypothetical protein